MSYGWRPYVSVAQRRVQAASKMNVLRKKGVDIQPVEIAGRKIARTFWGQSWCKHLEAFSDYANRLPRGRTYVCNGSVCHLLVASGEVKAIVSGSELYNVTIKIKALPAVKWSSVKARCAGQIGSLIELLQGRLSHDVMAVVTHRSEGLFPAPSEITLDCSCPDWATMCKHVAAVMYGVGARLDERPELLFLLRGVDHEELIDVDAAAALTSSDNARQRGRRRIDAGDLEDVFGIEMIETANLAMTKPKLNGSSQIAERKKTHEIQKTIASKKTVESKKIADSTKTVATGKTLPAAASFGDKPPTAKAVRDLRTSLDLTFSSFALLLGVSASTASGWEKKRGRLNLQPRTLESLRAVAKLTKNQALRRLDKFS